jgi:hypothetical protein
VILVLDGAIHEYRLLGAPVKRGPSLDETSPPDLTSLPHHHMPLQFEHRTARAPLSPFSVTADAEAGSAADRNGSGGDGDGSGGGGGDEGSGEKGQEGGRDGSLILTDSMFIVNEVGSTHLSYTGKEVIYLFRCCASINR